MHRYAIVLTLVVAAVPTAAGAAVAPAPAPPPVTLSFASDDNHDGPTFHGISGGTLADAGSLSLDGLVNVDLMVDKNGDAAGGVTVIPSFFFFSGTISNFTLGAATGGWVIQWDVAGSFVFVDAASGTILLTVNFDNALLTTYSPNVFTLGQTATLQSSDDVDPGLTMVPTSLFTFLTGVGATSFSNSEDFAFTFTNLRNIDGGGGLPRIDHGTFLRNWASEGSFSAHAAPTADVEEVPVE